MPFPTALSGGQITQVQKNIQSFDHYLLVNPNNIVWQAQVDDTKSAEVYGDFEWVTTLQGARGDVKAGQVCFITTSATDFTAPVIRGRVRKVPGATTFNINEVGTDIDNAMFVTVIDDYDLVEKLQRLDLDGDKFKDFDIPWEDLPPTIEDLQSTYADVEGNVLVIPFDPTGTAQADGAAIASWLWDVADGTVTVNTINDRNPTVSFPVTSEFRWVSVTVTDDNGNAITFNIEVYTVDPSASAAGYQSPMSEARTIFAGETVTQPGSLEVTGSLNVEGSLVQVANLPVLITDISEITVTGTIEEGWNATLTPWANFDKSTVLDQTRCTLVSVDNYGGTTTPITANIIMIGRLKTENSTSTGDQQHGLLQSASLTLEGFAAQLAELPAPSVFIEDTDSPSEWGEITDPDPTRAMIYLLAFHTTFLSLCSVAFEDLNAFTYLDFRLDETRALDNLNQQAQTVNAVAMFAPAGEMTVQRRAAYLASGDRGGLVTVYDFVKGDITEFSSSIAYGENVGQVEAGAIVYSTGRKELDQRYVGRAPAESFGSGHETAQLNGQILEADSSTSDARTEVASRTANHLAFVNPKFHFPSTLMDGFYWLVPTVHQRYTRTIIAADSVRGRAFGTSDFMQLLEVNYTLIKENEQSSRIVTAIFKEETLGTNAGVLVTLIANSANFQIPALPPLSAYNDFITDPLTGFPTDTPIDNSPSGYASTQPYPIEEPRIGEEILNVNMRSGVGVLTTRTTTLNETYVITVQGDGQIGADTVTTTVDFAASDGNWQPGDGAALLSSGTYVNATGWLYTDFTVGATLRRSVSIEFPLVGIVVTRIKMFFNFTKGQFGDGNNPAYFIGAGAGIPLQQTSFNAASDGDGQTFEWTGTHTVDAVIGIGLRCHNRVGVAQAGNALITKVEYDVQGAGRGDAFYKDYSTQGTGILYTGLNGLVVNTVKPGNIPVFNAGHVYQFEFTGTGSKVSFKYNDADLTDNDNLNLVVTVRGPNMGYTA